MVTVKEHYKLFVLVTFYMYIVIIVFTHSLRELKLYLNSTVTDYTTTELQCSNCTLALIVQTQSHY